jgi:hypothetical protein
LPLSNSLLTTFLIKRPSIPKIFITTLELFFNSKEIFVSLSAGFGKTFIGHAGAIEFVVSSIPTTA